MVHTLPKTRLRWTGMFVVGMAIARHVVDACWLLISLRPALHVLQIRSHYCRVGVFLCEYIAHMAHQLALVHIIAWTSFGFRYVLAVSLEIWNPSTP